MQAEQARQNEQEALARTKQLEQQLSDLKARQTERGLELTLSGVLFELDKANLTPGAVRSLGPLVTFLRENPDRTVAIEGHTDSLGSDAYNQQLSQRRAEAVRDFLVHNGIASDRITARHMGESYPVASNDTEAPAAKSPGRDGHIESGAANGAAAESTKFPLACRAGASV